MTSLRDPRRFVLLDRDGTINVERHYLSAPDQLELYPGVGEALAQLKDLGYGLVIVTNQSGIARGYFDLPTLDRIHDRLHALLAPFNVTIDGIYLCPHGPDEGCSCRKPLPGMVNQAVADLGFDPARAIMVGDKAVDVQLGHAVGAASILVRTGHGLKSEGKCAPELIADDLPAAVRWIEQTFGRGDAF
ncbi:MAG TPA: D-glycero-beta-D-manno-heptose 1,7-bisphosphate 7-phosphatase [Candidatus Sulfotelmatobacter sp.]|jgi:D-glycero-D-manno-heptose 1,7-bisphosphate phosphatase|nr:D-glycero-beta-D-manno-heptose 1,7-bisphosphate 7-phosphatase [Candidatus Sulfotelmatobacter sp.]